MRGLPKRGLTVLFALLLLLPFLLWLGSRAVWHQDPYASQAKALAAPYRFDFVGWEARALTTEVQEQYWTRTVDPSSLSAKALVLDYLRVGQQMGGLKGDIERLAAEGATVDDPRIASLEARVRALRRLQEERRPIVEKILAAQVTAVLADERIGWFGRPLPPVVFQFTEPPYYLILSPRDRIELRLGIYLQPHLSLATRVALEEAAEQTLPNTSALVEGIGGLATWPTMLVDTADIRWVVTTIAHEWVHTYLILYPLGQRYFDSPDMAAINETVADMVGQEIGHKVLARFYPEHAPPQEPVGPSQVKPVTPTPTPAFDFVREMRITRETVDRLLAEGRIAEAEAYMEARRRVFVAHGYYIRKLNQAYFAFHGTYRTGPAAPAEDPIAPRLRRLRAQSASLAEFLAKVREIRRLDDLMRLVP